MKPHALILIREHFLLTAFCDAFRSVGIDARPVTTIGDVLAESLREQFRAVVVDLECASEGPEALRDVRRSFGGESATIFALVQGRETMRTAYECGADFVLRKPVTPDKITSSLKVMDELRANITLAQRLLALRPATK